MGQVTDRVMVSRWLAGYEAAWRAPGTDGVAEIFTDDAAYLHSPYAEPVVGLGAGAPTPPATASDHCPAHAAMSVVWRVTVMRAEAGDLHESASPAGTSTAAA